MTREANPPPNTVVNVPTHAEKASEDSTEEECKTEELYDNNTKMPAANQKPAAKTCKQLTQSPTEDTVKICRYRANVLPMV